MTTEQLPDDAGQSMRLIVEGTRLLTTRIPLLFERRTEGITYRQWEALKVILSARTPEISLSDITSFMGYSRQNVKKLVAGLEKAGYVTLEPSHIDGRALRVEATRRARSAAPALEAAEQRMLGELFSGVEDEDLSTAGRAMSRMISNVS